MRIFFAAPLSIPVLFLLIACDIIDKERCGDDFVYERDREACMPISSVDTSVNNDTSSVDAGTDAAPIDTVTGIGEYCENQAQCAEYEANYCGVNPLAPGGMCTLADCSPDPDDCPSGFACCEFVSGLGFTYPNLCIPEDIWNEYGTLVCIQY